MPPTSDYLKHLETSLAQGNATEHTHRPALHSLLTSLFPELLVTNEPRHIACGAPDFVISKSLNIGALTLGYIETKDVGKLLDQVERTPQLKRYLSSIENMLLTDYIEFRWYVNGERRKTVRLAEITQDGKFKKIRDSSAALEGLLADFLAHQPQELTSPRDLAQRMARLTHLIRDIIFEAFNCGEASTLLQGWREAFAKVLVADLDQPEKTGEFADMLAQTLAYGLFSARLRDLTPGFTRQEAQTLIPRTNPFLRDFFYQITGPQLDDEPFASFVDDIVSLLAHTDMHAVLADFGKRTRQEDPVVHFYETFLAAYDPKLRESRGVYFTPEPIVSYIVRSVDYLLKTRFNIPEGLADNSKIIIRNTDPAKVVKGTNQVRKTTESHRVLVLDPATGTGTFLYGVIDLIRQRFIDQGNAGMWPGYVREHLLPRLFGFELLMAPYAVAHFKLALQLAAQDLPEPMQKDWAYDFASNERIRVYLTNTLEAIHEHTGLPLFTSFLATETDAANQVKQDLPIMVILGNPPYSNFGQMNKGEYISNLMGNWMPDGEKKWNPDDFMKFIRWAQVRIKSTGLGIIAFVTNHTYLDGITHRSMRESLANDFDEIYILDLHGNRRRGEVAPNNLQDENVFDIQQGVSIGIFIKNPQYNSKDCQIYFSELWGSRDYKYTELLTKNLSDTEWILLDNRLQESCLGNYKFFKPKGFANVDEYCTGVSIKNIFLISNSGIQTGRDEFVSTINQDEFDRWISYLQNPSIFMPDIERKVSLPIWSGFQLDQFRDSLRNREKLSRMKIKWLYRPFDVRPLLFDESCIKRTRGDVMKHMLLQNLALITVRQLATENFSHIFSCRYPGDGNAISLNTREYNFYFPLFQYLSQQLIQNNFLATTPWPIDELGRIPNLNPEFVKSLEEKLNLPFDPHKSLSQSITFGPEDIFNSIYAIFHSPAYRTRYAEFLKIDFPRVPITSNPDLFWRLSALGGELVSLHLLESPQLAHLITRYPAPGDNLVEKSYPKYVETQQRVYINKDQYFEGVPPEVWDFHVGGYQVCEKWLKDRRTRQLTYDDLTHYQKIVVAINETIRLMTEIDQTIDTHGSWPIQ